MIRHQLILYLQDIPTGIAHIILSNDNQSIPKLLEATCWVVSIQNCFFAIQGFKAFAIRNIIFNDLYHHCLCHYSSLYPVSSKCLLSRSLRQHDIYSTSHQPCRSPHMTNAVTINNRNAVNDKASEAPIYDVFAH